MKFSKVIPILTIFFSILFGGYMTLGGQPLLPSFLLIFAFYWIICRPDLVPIWSLFLIGIFYDVLMMHPIGLTSTFLIISYFVLVRIRHILKPDKFYLFWGSYAVYSLSYLSLYALFTFTFIPSLMSWILALCLYPLVSWSLSNFQIRFLSHA